MRELYKIAFSLLITVDCIGQNLVPNPSFEDTIACPVGPAELEKAIGWSSEYGSCDYMNACCEYPIDGTMSVPYNWGGFQRAASGKAYAAIATYHGFVPNYREFAKSTLSANLNIGTRYYVSFKASLSLGYSADANCASNKLGAMFSTVDTAYINNNPHVFSDLIITDTLNWVQIFGSFVADSAYSRIIVGNFFDNSSTDTIKFYDTFSDVAYYYIDDICVSTDSVFAATWTTVQNETDQKMPLIFPNPANDVVFITGVPNGEKCSIRIFDATGRQIEQALLVKNENQIDVSHFVSGIYIIQLSIAGKSITGKLIIN